MSKISDLKSIILNEERDNIIPFFKNITEQERRELSKIFEDEFKEHFKVEHKVVRNRYIIERSCTDEQEVLRDIARFFIHPAKKMQNFGFHRIFKSGMLDEILEAYCPKWFSGTSQRWGFLDYIKAMEYERKGYITLQREFIVRTLPRSIIERHYDEVKKSYALIKPEMLLKYPETLNKHFWWLFSDDTGMKWHDETWIGNNKPKTVNIWKQTIKDFTDSGKIDRNRVLKESLLTANRNFSRANAGWFIDLHKFLKPTIEEIINQQEAFNLILTSEHSKAKNYALQNVKKIVAEPKFNHKLFLDQVPVLLASDVISTVKSTLILLDKVAVQKPKSKGQITTLASQALVHEKEDIQLRTAKLIVKHGNNKNKELLEQIALYSSYLFSEPKQMLNPFLKEITELDDNIPESTPDQTGLESESFRPDFSEPVPIEDGVKTIDDFIFFLSQILDNNRSIDFYLLPHYYLKFQDQLNSDQVLDQLQPVLQRAINLLQKDMRSTDGYLDVMMAATIVSLVNHLIEKYPDSGKNLKSYYRKEVNEERRKAKENKFFDTQIHGLERWAYSSMIYNIPKQHMFNFLTLVRRNIKLQFLSTPTHYPCLIDLDTFLGRLKQYEEYGKLPFSVDFQIALSRLIVDVKESAIEKVEASLKNGPVKQALMVGFNTKRGEPSNTTYEAPILHSWITFNRNEEAFPLKEYSNFNNLKYYAGKVDFELKEVEYTYIDFDYSGRTYKRIKKKGVREELVTSTNIKENKESLVRKILKVFKKSLPKVVSNYDNIQFNYQWQTSEHNDIARLLLLFPNYFEPFLTRLSEKIFNLKDSGGKNEAKLVASVNETLLELQAPLKNGSHLYLANALLYSDRTARDLSAAVWLRFTELKLVDNRLLGENIGYMLSKNYFPLKRFTDILSERLFRTNPNTDAELLVLLNSMIVNMPDKPLTNTKKMLEIHKELVTKYGFTISDLVKNKFESWNSSPSLRRIISNFPNK